ncbi:MAG: metallophosphatase, partial [Gammaproteobacteria bacterium]|nr:metallophosphatase [Gammaproteobacteria bacterium]
MPPMLKNLILSLFLVVLIVAPARAGDWRVDNVDRVVAISDVHGAYDAMVETLRNVDILDDELSWAGGTSHLVIVGDLL